MWAPIRIWRLTTWRGCPSRFFSSAMKPCRCHTTTGPSSPRLNGWSKLGPPEPEPEVELIKYRQRELEQAQVAARVTAHSRSAFHNPALRSRSALKPGSLREFQ